MRTVIVEDHSLTRDRIREVCAREFGWPLVGEADDGAQAIEVIFRVRPELLLLDVQLPSISGFGVVDTIRRAGLDPHILLLSDFCDDYAVYRVERARVHGFVDKRCGTSNQLKEALAAARV